MVIAGPGACEVTRWPWSWSTRQVDRARFTVGLLYGLGHLVTTPLPTIIEGCPCRRGGGARRVTAGSAFVSGSHDEVRAEARPVRGEHASRTPGHADEEPRRCPAEVVLRSAPE